jgi:hypothetical protein
VSDGVRMTVALGAAEREAIHRAVAAGEVSVASLQINGRPALVIVAKRGRNATERP